MTVLVDGIDELRASVAAWRRDGLRIGFVPTMGNLHAGHLALVDLARERCDRVVASLFVNPTQFGPGEDYERYPRTLDADMVGLQLHACDIAFAPSVQAMYPLGLTQAHRLLPTGLADVLCGRHRPGHFDGVLTVVARLFNLVQPDLAVFGEKDFQQLRLVERMTLDMGYGLDIMRAPIVREPDGLAMSSRNRYLDADERARAATLRATLVALGQGWAQHRPVAALESEGRERLQAAGFVVDYMEIRREDDLAPVSKERDGVRIFAAAKLGSTRLIDNFALSSDE